MKERIRGLPAILERKVFASRCQLFLLLILLLVKIHNVYPFVRFTSVSKRLARLYSSEENVWRQLESTQQKVEKQQQQIDKLIELLQLQTQEGPENSGTQLKSLGGNSITPLKVMLFIDGTWLYYSIFEREELVCPIKNKFGRNWKATHKVDWAALPRIVAENLHDPGWTVGSEENQQQRPIEIVRAYVTTSYKADTPTFSNRYRMFEAMKEANYDVSMMETVGPGEKCVDIQLAVEMLHFATVPGAYDVALLLTGDKDFCPAMIRTRQKGRKVGLVSMRTGCNAALYDTPNIKDYDVVWLDEYLETLIVPKTSGDFDTSHITISQYTLLKILVDFVDRSGIGKVTARDVGRYFKSLSYGTDSSVLAELKQSYYNLKSFLVQTQLASIEDRRSKNDPSDRAFWIHLDLPESKRTLAEQANTVSLTSDEKLFWEQYSTDALKDKKKYYQHSLAIGGVMPTSSGGREIDFASMKVAELKEYCREHSLPVSGTKAVLLERVKEYFGKESGEPKMGSAKDELAPTNVDDFLKGVLSEYLQASHGRASSRNIGRFMSSHRSSDGSKTALVELKQHYGGLLQFINQAGHRKFEIHKNGGDKSSYEFEVAFRSSSQE